MARIFLDTNIFIDAVFRKPEITKQFVGSVIYYSPLSVHILYYAFKLKVPSPAVISIIGKFEPIDLSKSILENALKGPTIDMEDNIQLHSAAEAFCENFLTNDARLLDMKFFGKTQILNSFG